MNGIIIIANSNGQSVSPWKIPLWIFTIASVFLPAVNSAFQFFMASVINLTSLSDILYILDILLSNFAGSHHRLFVVNLLNGYIFQPLLALLDDVLINILLSQLFHLFPFGTFSIRRETVRNVQESYKSLSNLCD